MFTLYSVHVRSLAFIVNKFIGLQLLVVFSFYVHPSIHPSIHRSRSTYCGTRRLTDVTSHVFWWQLFSCSVTATLRPIRSFTAGSARTSRSISCATRSPDWYVARALVDRLLRRPGWRRAACEGPWRPTHSTPRPPVRAWRSIRITWPSCDVTTIVRTRILDLLLLFRADVSDQLICVRFSVVGYIVVQLHWGERAGVFVTGQTKGELLKYQLNVPRTQNMSGRWHVVVRRLRPDYRLT